MPFCESFEILAKSPITSSLKSKDEYRMASEDRRFIGIQTVVIVIALAVSSLVNVVLVHKMSSLSGEFSSEIRRIEKEVHETRHGSHIQTWKRQQ